MVTSPWIPFTLLPTELFPVVQMKTHSFHCTYAQHLFIIILFMNIYLTETSEFTNFVSPRQRIGGPGGNTFNYKLHYFFYLANWASCFKNNESEQPRKQIFPKVQERLTHCILNIPLIFMILYNLLAQCISFFSLLQFQNGKHRSVKRCDSIDDDDLPPSYEQATQGMEEDSPKPALPARKKDVMTDMLFLSPTETSHNNTNFEVFMPSPSPPTNCAPVPPLPHPAPIQTKKTDPVDLLSGDLATFNFSLASSNNNNMNEQTNIQTIPQRPITITLPPPKNTSHKLSSRSMMSHSAAKSKPSHRKPYRKWNPPLLGSLPDDFLRLETVPKMSSFMRDDSSMEHATHHPVMLSRRSSTPVASTFAQRTSPNQNLNRPKRTQSSAASPATPCDFNRNRPERDSESYILVSYYFILKNV
jgi:hypothetical protein